MNNLYKSSLIAILGIVMIAFVSFERNSQKDAPPIHQLRIYQIPENNVKVFHERFRDHASRIMKKYHFNIIAMWESKFNEKTEFIYLLQWKNKQTMDDSWKQFMADQEWKDIKKRTAELHGNYVDSIQNRTLIVTDYSPRKSF
jgi:hypothetical protein